MKQAILILISLAVIIGFCSCNTTESYSSKESTLTTEPAPSPSPACKPISTASPSPSSAVIPTIEAIPTAKPLTQQENDTLNRKFSDFLKKKRDFSDAKIQKMIINLFSLLKTRKRTMLGTISCSKSQREDGGETAGCEGVLLYYKIVGEDILIAAGFDGSNGKRLISCLKISSSIYKEVGFDVLETGYSFGMGGQNHGAYYTINDITKILDEFMDKTMVFQIYVKEFNIQDIPDKYKIMTQEVNKTADSGRALAWSLWMPKTFKKYYQKALKSYGKIKTSLVSKIKSINDFDKVDIAKVPEIDCIYLRIYGDYNGYKDN